MDIDRLHYFCVVARAGSLSRASELLNISQPALSKAMKLLEAEVDLKLFTPSGRGLSITDNGVRLLKEAEPLVQNLLSLKDRLKQTKYIKTVRVASFEVFSTYFLGYLVEHYFSDIAFEVLETVPGELESAIVERKADVGLTYLPIPHPDLDFLKITQLKMGVFGVKDVFEEEAFADIPFVAPMTPVDNTPSKAKGLDGWPDDRVQRWVKYRVTMMETALDLCRRGVAVGYFPEFVVHLHNLHSAPDRRLDALSFPRAAATVQSVFLVKRKTDVEDSFHKKIAKALRGLCKVKVSEGLSELINRD